METVEGSTAEVDRATNMSCVEARENIRFRASYQPITDAEAGPPSTGSVPINRAEWVERLEHCTAKRKESVPSGD